MRVPVIWATQVLDELDKDSLPSRTEISDAAMSQRAACVMLNKGPHVIEVIAFLSDVIGRIGWYEREKSALLSALHSWPLDTLAIEP